MQSWPASDVPRLPGTGLPLRAHDVAAGGVRPLSPGRTATLYVCGITPYDATHLGHAATYLAFDLLHRGWLDGGHEVRFVENVTDVDEPLLERAERDGQDWRELARAQTQLFRDDMAALRILPPDELVGAVDAIPDVVAMVRRILDAGAAYELEGDLYLSVRDVDRFGAVASLDRETMTRLARENGGDPDRPGKRDPLDSVLWWRERPDEPSWESALGRGRPGWHVECAAIAATRLGDSFDVLGGGADLLFPHHEHSCATTAAATGAWPVARAVVHAGLVAYDGEKMSKSLGNLVFVHRLRDVADPAAVRLALLAHHYRSSWEWCDSELAEAEARLARWRAATGAAAGPDAEPVLREVRAALADDLDAPRALRVVDRWAEEARLRGGRTEGAGALVHDLADALLGVRL